MMLSGMVVYLSNYKRSGKDGKMRARVGIGVLAAGTFIAFGQKIIDLVLSGN